jgi:hypothetical protein
MADETQIQVLKEPERNPETDSFIDAVPKGKQYDYSNPAVQFCSKLFDISFGASSK